MSTSITQFKFIDPNGLTRRATFHTTPNWKLLSEKIEVLFGVPASNAAVIYRDAEGDQVTMSSQEELDDYYRAHLMSGEPVVKFIVQDLSSIRNQRPPSATLYNIQDPNPFTADIEDDWQALPVPKLHLSSVFGPPSADTTHAFLEPVGSDATARSVTHSTTHSTPHTPFTVPLNKGKERAFLEDDVLSTASVLLDDPPVKHPVHVYDISFRNNATPKADAASFTDQSDKDAMHVDEPPKVPAPQPSTGREEAPLDSPPDPPLVSLESNNLETPPSITNDIASLLNALNSAIHGHPELSEGIRNIVRNASSGVYWTTHREAVSQAAQEFVDSAGQVRRDAEAEAARRVADALTQVVQTLSNLPGVPCARETGSGAIPETGTTPSLGAAQNAQNPQTSTGGTFTGGIYSRRSHGPSHPFSQPFPHWMPSAWRFPPPPVPAIPPFPDFTASQNGSPFPPPPPPPPPPPHAHGIWNVPPSWPVPPPPHVFGNMNGSDMKSELRANVQAAKAQYRAEKQRYREEREQMRKATNTAAGARRNDDAAGEGSPKVSRDNAAQVPEPAIAVQGRHGNPTIEVVSVNRNSTFPSHRPFGRGRGSMDFTTRTTNRIVRRLADMGFTETMHPNLASRVKAQLPPSGVLTNEAEDDVVTTLLEELLAPKPQRGASGTEDDIPGSWQ